MNFLMSLSALLFSFTLVTFTSPTFAKDSQKTKVESKKLEAKEEGNKKETAEQKGKKKGKPVFAIMDIHQGDKSLGKVKIKLFHNYTPVTVENFAGLAEGTKEFKDFKNEKNGQAPTVKRPYYDGLTFHRVISGFMIQGGDPLGNGRGGPGFDFDDEIHPSLSHDKPGILSMANAGKGPDGKGTNGSQFFITLVPTKYLDGKHTVFGEVVEGMDIIETVGEVATDASDRPKTPVIMKTVEIIRE